jgi:hypothetical protein
MLYKFSFTSTFKWVYKQKIFLYYILFNESIPLTNCFLDCTPFIVSNSYRRVNGDSSHNKSNERLVKVYFKFIETM